MCQKATAAVYLRYSSHNQRDVSIDQQLRACELFAVQNEIRITDRYEDHALTGTTDRRPGFQEMIRDAASAGWSYVIVYSVDRFARDRYDSAVYKRKLRDYGVKVLSATENISDDPSGVLLESVLEGLADYYSKELSTKIRRGMEDNARHCMVTGSVPLGYVRGPDGRYAMVAREAQLVKEIYTRVAEGEPFTEIISDLNARGETTKTGKPWNKSSFNRLLSNVRYKGIYVYKGNQVPDGIPRIVSDLLFEQVQERLHTKPNARGPGRRQRENSIYLLTGKLFCGRCKAPMIGISGRGRNGDPHYYYICRGKRTAHACEMPMVRREWVEDTITKAIRQYILTDKVIEKLADAVIAYQEKDCIHAESEALKAKLADVKKAIKNIVSAIEAGIFSSSTQSRLTELEEEEQLLSNQIALAQAKADQRLTRSEVIAALMLYRHGDVYDKSYQEKLIDTFLIKAYLFDDKINIVFRLGDNQEEVSDQILDNASEPDCGLYNQTLPPP